MTLRYTAAALAILAVGTARADDDFSFKFSGFGTASAVHSGERRADFVASPIQSSGAGYTRATSLDPDTKVGGQVNVKFGEKFSAVVQVVSQHQYDNSYTPQIEWANVKYQVTPELSVRLGRIALPVLLLSETRLVGYANTWVRPPSEVYGLLPMTNNDGIDATYRSTIGSVNNALQALYGVNELKIPSGTVKSNPSWGINDTVEYGSATLRASFYSGTSSFRIAGIDGLIGGLNQFAAGAAAVPVPAFQSAGAQAASLASTYQPSGIRTNVFAVGAGYDPGNWFVSGEFIAERPALSLLSSANGWYVNGGYRFGSLTPYATYASVKAKVKTVSGISTVGADALAPGAAALNGGLNATLTSFAGSQSSVTAGLRWDFMTNLALKAEFQRVSLGADSTGRLTNVQPGFVPGGKVNLVTVALDFVF